MDGTALVMDGLVRGGQALSQNLDGLTDEELHGEPHPSIAWMAWRAGRVIDHNVADLIAEPQIWVKDGWHERFGMAPDPVDFGPGQLHTKEHVQAFRTPSAQTLLDYYDACLASARSFVEALSPADLDRVLDEPRYDPMPTVGVRLVSVTVAVAQSTGTVRYLHWLHRRGGWFPGDEARS